MPLSILDATLLALLLGGIFYIVAGDLAAYFVDSGQGVGAAVKGRLSPLRTPRLRAIPLWADDANRPALTPRRMPPVAVLPHAADLLVVDDSAVARTKLRRLFGENGYEVHLASDGVEALKMLEAGRYSLMITDLEMPNMDGIALIHECLARPQTARMPIIAVSAHENLRATFNECRDICGVHRKPWADDILLSHVATVISARGVLVEREGRRLRMVA